MTQNKQTLEESISLLEEEYGEEAVFEAVINWLTENGGY